MKKFAVCFAFTIILAISSSVVSAAEPPAQPPKEQVRVAAVYDLTALAAKIDQMNAALEQLAKQNAELRKQNETSVKTLEEIAVLVGTMRHPIKWEYRFLRARTEKLMNELGQEGWELVGMFEDKEWAIFKRPVIIEREEVPPPPEPAPK